MITAVVVDGGEPFLKSSLKSLRAQTVPTKIIVAPSDKTDIGIAKKYADKVMKPVDGIGRARVQAILEASTPYILSCDSDTFYPPKYAEYALETLRHWNAVKAGIILPLEGRNPLAWAEVATQPWFAYEFSLGFRRQAFLDAGIHRDDYSQQKNDIGRAVMVKLIPVPNPRMVCYTRLPTYHAELAVDYIPIALVGFAPLVASVGIPLLNEAWRIIHK
ncbi:hypothetical protein ES702_03851 [subsurface metagenome]